MYISSFSADILVLKYKAVLPWIMESLTNYDLKLKHEYKLKKFLISLYRRYWPFLRGLTCTEKMALTHYKNGSEAINSMLWLPEEHEAFRSQIVQYLTGLRPSTAFITELTTEFITKQIATIHVLESLFKNAPTLNREIIVFRGISKLYSDSYKPLKSGKKWISKSFMSTTFNFNSALTISQWGTTGMAGLVVVISVPVHTPYLLLPGNGATTYTDIHSVENFMKNVTYLSDEMELLLNKNTELKFIRSEKLRITPSSDILHKSFEDTNYVNLYYLRVENSSTIIFNKTPADIITDIASVSFDLKQQTKTTS